MPPRKLLPASFHYAGDQALVRHLAEAETGELEFTQESARSACELAAVAQANFRRIFWQFIEGVYSGEPLLDVFVHIENSLFERLALVKLSFYHALALFLSCDLRFFCHYSSISSCGQALFGAACG